MGPHLAWQAQHFGDAKAEVVAGAAFGSCLKGWGVCRARLWAPISRGRRSTLEMQVLKSWQAQYFVHLGLRSGACLFFFFFLKKNGAKQFVSVTIGEVLLPEELGACKKMHLAAD